MAKPKHPLLSLGARGTIADNLTFQKRAKGTIARTKPIPRDPRSPAQLAWRQVYRTAVTIWNALTFEEKVAWRGVCPGLTPFQCFMRSELKWAPPPPPPVEVTFYPDAHPEVTSVDGRLAFTWAQHSFSQLVAGAGTTAQDDSNYLNVTIYSDGFVDKWHTIYRSILLFDTSALPDDCTIISAILYIYGEGKTDTLGIAPTINLFASNPATNIALIPADYATLGTTPLCDTPIAYADFKTGTPGDPNTFALNAAGLALISKTGITKLGLREATYDAPDNPPSWSADKVCSMVGWAVDKGGDYRPKLVVTYTP